MNKKSCCIFIIISLIPGFLFAQTRLAVGEKKVPVVVYTPFDFYGRLMDAFKCGSEQDYYVVTADKTYLYDNRIGPEYYQGKYCERQLREAPILNISNFRKAILSNDSCFFFSPTPSRKYNNAYLGIKRGAALSFVDINGVEYASLEELLTKTYDTESLDVFFDAYLSEVRRALYRRGTYNMLYLIRDENQAKKILKDNYDFVYFHDQDLDLAIDNFVNYVISTIHNGAAGEKLKSHLKEFIAGQPKQESFNKAFRAYINDNHDDRIYLTLVDVSPVLRSNLTSQAYERFSKKYAIDRQKTIAAYKYLAKKYHKEIYQDRLAGWDPIYDTIVDYLTKNVLFSTACTGDCSEQIKTFYATYLENVLHDNSRNEELCKSCLTEELLEKVNRLRAATDADPIIRAQDANMDAIETLKVKPLAKNWYMVSYCWSKKDSTTLTEIPVKAQRIKGKCFITDITPVWSGTQYGDELIP